jgi:peptide/nickel transport system permease protein
MWMYIVRRTIHSVIVLFVVSLLCFTLMHLMPGNPWASIGMTEEQREFVQEQLRLHGLDQPIYIQYIRWLKGLANGYLGLDYNFASIDQYIWSYVKNSLTLMVTAWILALMITFPWAIYNSRRPNGLSDTTALILGVVGFSIPLFYLGIMLKQVFAMQLFWLPPSSMHTPNRTGELWDLIVHMMLPVTTLTISMLAYYLKFVRNSMLDVLPADYLRTARAKGVPERRVIYRHALRNASIPIITMLALDLPAIMSGSVVIERVFNWHGIGWLLVRSAQVRNLPVLIAILMIVSVVVIIANWLADMLYLLVDPRVRLSGSRSRSR